MPLLYKILKPLLLPLAAAALLPASPVAAGDPYICDDVLKPFFRSAALRDGRLRISPARAGAVAAPFLMPKPEGTARVFVVGESAAGLLGAGEDGLAAYLGGVLGGRPVEIINCGMGAYESLRILDVFREALAYSPDLIVVLSGNNETGREFCGGLKFGLAGRLLRARALLGRMRRPREEAAIQASLDAHEARLEKMAALARGRAPVLFVTLPANMRDYAPDGPLPDRLRPGAASLASDPAAALGFFENSLVAAPRDPFSHFYSGRALEALGRGDSARAAYAAAIKYDPASDRCSEARNAMIKRAAAAGGACVADLAAAFSGIARNGAPGRGEIADGVHWLPRYNAFAGAVIAAAAAGCPTAPAAWRGRGPNPAATLPPGPATGDFRKALSYACAYSGHDLFFGRYRPNERVLSLLDGLCADDCARLRLALYDEGALVRELLDSGWSLSLRADRAAWRPYLLAAAAEMFARRGLGADASKALKESEAAKASLPRARRRLPGEADGGSPATARPLRRLEAESKQLSDQAALKLREGNRAAAKKLANLAAEKDPDNFSARMTACYLAAGDRDDAYGERHCGEAVYVALNPPLHYVGPAGAEYRAFRARAEFYLALGETAKACVDAGFAHKSAAGPEEEAWALELLRGRCGGAD